MALRVGRANPGKLTMGKAKKQNLTMAKPQSHGTLRVTDNGRLATAPSRVRQVGGTYNPQAGYQGFTTGSSANVRIAGGSGGGATGGSVASAAPTQAELEYAAYAQQQAQAAAEAAAKKAEEDAKRNKYRKTANTTLDELQRLYDQIDQLIQRAAGDHTNRINKSYDDKVGDQVTGMNEGMYDVDVSSAAGNLSDSSFRSFDRGKVRTAADSNIETLNDGRSDDLSVIGKQSATDRAKYRADKLGIGRTREMLGETEDINELMGTVNKLDSTKRGVGAAKAGYNTRSNFAKLANKAGNYDTSALEQSLQSVIANTSATPSTKQAAVGDLLNGTPLDEQKKKELKNKYTQNIG